MESCSCADILWLEDGSGLYFMQKQHAHMSPPPKARSFDLPGDRVLYAPDRPADVQHVRLDIALDFAQETVSGTVYTTFSALFDEVKTVTFDAIDLHIERVIAGSDDHGKELLFSNDAKKLVVALDRPYRYGEQFTIAIEYHAKPRTGLHFIKPAPEDPTRPVQVWTVGQPSYHRYWFPCHDAPNDRATTEMIVTVPAQFLTVSNGNLLSVTDNGATKTHHWRHDVPHATYLVSLVVGEFAVIEDSYNGKPLTYYVRPDRKDDAPYLLSKTPQMMQFFSAYTGVEYPYDKYAQTVVEIYANAMEHTTATTHSFSLLMDKKASLDVDYVAVVAHELAHQWFGDLVTCRDWSNGWLNEGFASYFTVLWAEHDRGKDVFKQAMLSEKQIYLQEDSSHRRPIVYYVTHEDGEELFDRHMYQKGCWVLHMLRHQLGDAAFRRGIKTYLERYRTREVITADLERTLEEATGRSLAQFFQQWVYQGGYPAFEVSYSWDSEHTMAKVKIRQTQQVDDLTPCFVTPIDLAFTIPTSDEAAKDADTTETRTIPMCVTVGEDGQSEQSFYLPLEREPVMVRFDPDGWLLKTLSFKRSGKMLRYQLAHDPDTLGRIEAAEGLGEEGDAESVAALKQCLFNDAFWGVRAAAATALGAIGTGATQTILLQALAELDATHYSRVRAAIAAALGQFAAPQQMELAQRSAQALGALLEKGDVSYVVEAAAAVALGKTRAEGSVDLLLKVVDRPSWNSWVQRGIFAGLAATGEDRVVNTIAAYLNDMSQHPTMRLAAALGMWALGRNRYLYSEEARQRAVTALCYAVEHDSWDPVRIGTPVALLFFGEKRAIGVLERAVVHELNTRAQRSMRVAVHVLRTGDTSDEQLRQLRTDLDLVREENRKFKEQLGAIEARLG
ncbi:MAG TPA: M1 family metallopeptidase [Ktedonobacteraceae bacterium]|nr:M1 family metallopeptidase [Ktedonobacteraceae bacterium]